jgi:hypothetical protein
MTISKESLDTIEQLFVDQLLAPEGSMPAAKLDILRKVLEKNNRLYVRPTAKDCGPALDAVSKELEAGDDLPMKLPFRRVK